MNSLRWRLSFSQNKSSRPLKIVWQEFSQTYGQYSIWSEQRRKSLVHLLDILETAIDQGSLSNWQTEFDHSGLDCIKSLLESAILASKEDFHVVVEESALTTNELITRILFVINHGLSSYCVSTNMFVEQLEMDPILIWNGLELLQIHSSSSSGIAIELIRLLRACTCSVSLAKLFVKRHGCSIIVDSVLSQISQGTVSCVHPAVSFLINIIGNARFSNVLSAPTATPANATFASNSLQSISRPRASSASSTGSYTQSRSSMGNHSSINAVSQQRIRTAEASDYPAMFAHLDGVESYHGGANANAWGIFAEMIRLTPFGIGGNLWTALADHRPFEYEDKQIRNGLGSQTVLDETEQQGIPKHIVTPDLASDDILAEKARIDEYFQTLREASFSPQPIVIPLDTCRSSIITSGNQFFVTAAQQAITAVEAINVFVLFSLCVVDDHENKASLMNEQLMLEIESMVVRVDEGLDFLGSCREQSLAMAKGDLGVDHVSPSKKTANSVDKEDSGVLFHIKVVSAMLKLVYDCVQLAVRDDETLILNNIIAYVWTINLAKRLFLTGRQRLQNISLQFILSIQRLSPIVVVAIDKCGLQVELLCFIAKFINSAPDNHLDIDKMSWAIFHSTLLVLRTQAITLRVDNQEISTMLAGILLRKWFPTYNLLESQRAFRCCNCESEIAQFECLGESCIRENCHLLCVECDKVFHKSSSKRAHIRLNCLRCYFCKDQSPTSDKDNWIPSCDAQIHGIIDKSLHPILNNVSFDRNPSVASLFSRELVSACLFSVISDIFMESSDGEYGLIGSLHAYICMLLMRRLTALPLCNISMNIELEASISSVVNECRFLLRNDSYFNSVTQGSSGLPSKWQRSPRRLFHNILIRYFSSFVLHHNAPNQSGDLTESLRLDGVLHGVKSIFSSGIDGEDITLRDIVCHGFDWQMDAILVHFIVSDSSQTHLGSSERQAIIWLLRELYQVGCDVGYPQVVTKSTACWISWCMRAGLSPSINSKSYPVCVPSDLKLVLPLGSPLLQRQTFLFLLQELCVLFGGFSRKVGHRRIDSIVLETEVHYARVDSKDSCNNQGTTIETPRSLAHATVHSKRHGVMFTLCRDHCRLENDFLCNADFVTLLLATAFGDLIDLIAHVPVSTLEKPFLKFANGIVSSSDDDQELFCLSIQLLGEIIALYPYARVIIDQVLCFRVFTMMLQGLSEAFDMVSSSERIKIILAKLVLHYCVSGSLCFHPIIPFDRIIIGMNKPSSEMMFQPRVISQKRFEQQQPQKTPLRISSTVDVSTVDAASENFSLVFSSGYHLFDEVRLLSCLVRGLRLSIAGDGFTFQELQPLLISIDFAQLVASEKRLGKQANRSQLSDDTFEDVGTPRSNVPRRSSRRLITSASNASFDAGDTTSRWEVESLGRSSAAHGDLVSRGSLGSNQSVVAIMQALKAMPIEAVLQLPECGTIRNGFSEPLSPQISAPTLTKENLVDRQKASSCIKQYDAEESVDYVSDLLVSLSGQLYSIAPILVVLHQCLVQRSGLTSWLEDIDHESLSDHQTSTFAMSTAEEHYYTLLKKHLNFIFLTRPEHISLLRGDYPMWNEILFRNEESMEHLLAVALMFGNCVHNISRTVLDQMLLRNVSCLHSLASSASTLLILHSIAATTPRMADYALKLLIQALSHSIDDVMLKYLVDTAHVGPLQESLHSFFIMQKVLDLRQPRSFLNFTCCLPHKSSTLKLRPVANPISGSGNKGFSVAMWLKLNYLEHGCVGNLFHCNVGEVFFFQVFIRSLYDVKDSNHRRKFQFCLRLGTRAVDSSSGSNVINASTSSISQRTSELQQQIWTLSTDALAGFCLPDYASILEDIPENKWTLFQLHYSEGEFALWIGGTILPLQRFSPQGYGISCAISPPEKQFIASVEKLLEKSHPTFVFGGDYLLDKIMSFHRELFGEGILEENIDEGAMLLPLEISEMFSAVKKVSRCMGMSISDIIVSDLPPSVDFQKQWLSNGAYGGLSASSLGGVSIIASLTQQDLFTYASTHQDKSCSQLRISGIHNFEPQSAGRGVGTNKIGAPQILQQDLISCSDVSVFCLQHLQHSLKHIGGFRVLLPLLLTGNSSKTNAAMELLLRCVHFEADYDSFVSDKLDAALMYAFTLMTSANASGALPLLCNWVRFPILDDLVGENIGQDIMANDSHARPEIISLISDTVCSLVGNLQAGLHWTKWAKDSVLDVPSRSSLLLKYVTPLAMLSLGCLWVFDDWNIEQCTPIQQEDYNQNATRRNTATASFSTAVPSNSMLDAACNAYLLQTQTFRLLRLTLLQQTLSTSASNSTSSSCVRNIVQTLQQLLMTALFCARRAASESLGVQRDRRSERENNRKLERLKAKLRSSASTAALLKQGDCFTSSYWHASAAVHLLRMVHDVLLRDLSLVRHLGSAVLSQVAVELLAHSVPELRAKAIVLAMLSAATPEAQIDAKRISDMEKFHFFELLNEQLTAARDPCDDFVLDALQNFLFWRLRLDEDTQYAYFCSVNATQGHNHQRGRTLVEDIAVPQCLGALFRLLHHARNSDILKIQLNSLLDFSIGGRIAHSLDSVSETNVEKLLIRKDWIWDLADLISAHQRRLQNETGASEEDVSGVFSLSESESLGGISFGSSSHYLSGAESDDASSVATADDGNMSHQANSSSPDSTKPILFDISSARTDFIARFIDPVKNFLAFIITCEFMKRPGVVRKWSDLFRLALPETSRLLEEILVLVLQDVQHVMVVQQECDAGVNYLSNIGAFLDMVMEKAPVSLRFCVFAVQSLQTLSYRCCQELRLKAAKDVQLREVRNSLLFRCLADAGQDLALRLSAVLELTVPLQAYVLQPEHKVLPESMVCVLLLGLWIDLFDDLQSNAYHQLKTSQDISFSVASADVNWLHTSLEGMTLLAGLIKSLLLVSAESQRLLGRLFESLINDEEKVLGGYFLPNKILPSSSASSNVIKLTRSSFGSSKDILVAATGQSNPNSLTHSGNPGNPSAINNGQNINSSASSSASNVGSSWWLGWSLGTISSAPASTAISTVDTTQIGQNVESADKGFVVPSGTSATMTGETEEAQQNSSKETNNRPTDDKSLVLWFCRSELSELHAEFRLKLGKELRLAVRTTDKLREKTSQRLLRHVKSLQDKRSRERLLQAKIVADGLQTTRTLLDKTQSLFLRELQTWQRSLRERIHNGRDVFRSLDIQIVPSGASSGISSSRLHKSTGEVHVDSITSASSDPSTLSSVKAESSNTTVADSGSIVMSEEQRRLRAMQSFQLPAALVEFLGEPLLHNPPQPIPSPRTATASDNQQNSNNKNGKLRPTEALHAMLECFGSAKRIVLLLD